MAHAHFFKPTTDHNGRYKGSFTCSDCGLIAFENDVLEALNVYFKPCEPIRIVVETAYERWLTRPVEVTPEVLARMKADHDKIRGPPGV